MDALFELKEYLKHIFTAAGPHGVHSPAVFNLLTDVLSPSKKHYCFDAIEAVRKELLSDKTEIPITDYGAGSRIQNKNYRTIQSIAKHSLQSPKCAQALFKIACSAKPNNILELGTSLGITTAYLASANLNSSVYSIEGDDEIAEIARQNIAKIGLNNVSVVNGTFETLLEPTLKSMGWMDLVLMDGNHRYAPTLAYFESIVHYLHEGSVVILDDIHWSKEMQKAWKEIINHSNVRVSIDFFHFGLLWFDPMFKKQDYILRLPS